MKQVIIDNRRFPYELGVRILKAKHGICQFPPLAKVWDKIPEPTIGSIVRDLPDLERRRIAFHYLGLERMLAQLRSKPIGSETVTKTTRWLERDGSVTEKTYDDTYELYRVDAAEIYRGLEQQSPMNQYLVKFHCPSTGKAHAIWVDIHSVYRTNAGPDAAEDPMNLSASALEEFVNPIMAIAWTIVTDLAPQDISMIIRQGDCVLFRKRPDAVRLPVQRHLTEREYRALLRAES